MTTGIVVDTDVVSFQFKADTRAAWYDQHLVGKLLVVSFMTIAELDQWAEQNNWGQARRQRLDQHLAKFVLHPFDRDLCRCWARIRDQVRRNGFLIGVADAWIAATAVLHQVPLVSHNADDYRGIPGLTLISENRP